MLVECDSGQVILEFDHLGDKLELEISRPLVPDRAKSDSRCFFFDDELGPDQVLCSVARPCEDLGNRNIEYVTKLRLLAIIFRPKRNDNLTISRVAASEAIVKWAGPALGFGSFAKTSDSLSIVKMKDLLCKPSAHFVNLVPVWFCQRLVFSGSRVFMEGNKHDRAPSQALTAALISSCRLNFRWRFESSLSSFKLAWLV